MHIQPPNPIVGVSLRGKEWRTKFEQIGKFFIELKIRLPPSISNLDDGLQEASGFRFPHVVECYEDEDRHVLLIAGRTIEL
jgi:hypothetical protein